MVRGGPSHRTLARNGTVVAIRECVFDTALPRWACVRERGRVRSPSTGFERDATHCPSRGEHVTVTRTLSRVVDRVEAYIINTAHSSDIRLIYQASINKVLIELV